MAIKIVSDKLKSRFNCKDDNYLDQIKQSTPKRYAAIMKVGLKEWLRQEQLIKDMVKIVYDELFESDSMTIEEFFDYVPRQRYNSVSVLKLRLSQIYRTKNAIRLKMRKHLVWLLALYLRLKQERGEETSINLSQIKEINYD